MIGHLSVSSNMASWETPERTEGGQPRGPLHPHGPKKGLVNPQDIPNYLPLCIDRITGVLENGDLMKVYGGLMGFNGIYPLVNVYVTMENNHFIAG